MTEARTVPEQPAEPLLCMDCGAELVERLAPCPSCGSDRHLIHDAPTVDRHPFQNGEVFAEKWRIERRLGAGGMATVYVAQDLSLRRRVAMKIVHGRLQSQPGMLERFEREAQFLAQLEHPHIVPVYEVGRHAGIPFMAMKLLDGVTVRDHLHARGGGLPAAEVLEILRQVCAGLTLIHSRGLVHRDIKAGNLFISPQGHVTILDFGLARDLHRTGLTRVGYMVGTPEYMPPEQARGEPVDARTDLYALGVVAFELLAGRRPFVSKNPVSLLERHLNAPVPDLTVSAPGISRALSDVVQRAMAKEPAHRFPSAPEMLAAFEAAGSKPPPPARRGRTVPLALTGAALASVGLLGWWALARRAAPPPTAPVSASASAPAPAPAPATEVQGVPEAMRDLPLPPPEEQPAAAPSPSRPAQGTLNVSATPSMNIAIDGVDWGTTPVRAALRPGGHTLSFKNDKEGLALTRSIRLERGQVRNESWRPAKGRVAFRVNPYGEVWLGAHSFGTTPMKPFELYEGRYEFRIVNAQRNAAVTRQVTVEPGQEAVVRVDLDAEAH